MLVIALRALVLTMSVTKATQAGFPPSCSPSISDFHIHPRLPWELFLSGVPDATHWTVTPPVPNSSAHGIPGLLLGLAVAPCRALSVLETAMDWSRDCEHLEARGN